MLPLSSETGVSLSLLIRSPKAHVAGPALMRAREVAVAHALCCCRHLTAMVGHTNGGAHTEACEKHELHQHGCVSLHSRHPPLSAIS